MVEVDRITKEVKLSRGDTAILSFDFEGDIPPDGTTCVITVKDHLVSKSGILTKSDSVRNAQVSFDFTEDDTKDLKFGTYYYDVRLFYADGSVITPIPPTPFKIVRVVGNN